MANGIIRMPLKFTKNYVMRLDQKFPLQIIWKIRHYSDTDSDLIRTVIPEAFGHRFRKSFGQFSASNRNIISTMPGEAFDILFSLDYLLMFFTNIKRRTCHYAKENANVGY